MRTFVDESGEAIACESRRATRNTHEGLVESVCHSVRGIERHIHIVVINHGCRYREIEDKERDYNRPSGNYVSSVGERRNDTSVNLM